MENNKAKAGVLKDSRAVALHYFETLVEVARESFLILDANLKVISGNPTFYQTFHVEHAQTENQYLYDLGNGQWNIPELKRLLEEILPQKKNVRDYEVRHDFETIGLKTMLLNARQIDSVQLIVLAIEDITVRVALESKLADYAKGLEDKIAKRTKELADKIKELEAVNNSMVGRELKMVELKKEIENLKKGVKNGK